MESSSQTTRVIQFLNTTMFQDWCKVRVSFEQYGSNSFWIPPIPGENQIDWGLEVFKSVFENGNNVFGTIFLFLVLFIVDFDLFAKWMTFLQIVDLLSLVVHQFPPDLNEFLSAIRSAFSITFHATSFFSKNTISDYETCSSRVPNSIKDAFFEKGFSCSFSMDIEGVFFTTLIILGTRFVLHCLVKRNIYISLGLVTKVMSLFKIRIILTMLVSLMLSEKKSAPIIWKETIIFCLCFMLLVWSLKYLYFRPVLLPEELKTEDKEKIRLRKDEIDKIVEKRRKKPQFLLFSIKKRKTSNWGSIRFNITSTPDLHLR